MAQPQKFRKHPAFPFRYEEEEPAILFDIYTNVIFVADFGPIKQGDVFDSVATNYLEGTICCFEEPENQDENMIQIHEVQFICIPKSEETP